MKGLKFAGVLAISMIFVAYSRPGVRCLGYLPSRIELPVGVTDRLAESLPSFVAAGGPDALEVDGRSAAEAPPVGGRPLTVMAVRPGAYRLVLRLGRVPVRTVAVRAVRTVHVIPGGESIGIALHMVGALILADRPVPGPRRFIDPARLAGLRPGDRILAADRLPIVGVEEFMRAVGEAGRKQKPLELSVSREGRLIRTAVKPAFDVALGRYRIGVVVRDGLTGIGTLTFEEPSSRLYAALGHRVQQGARGRPIPITHGVVGEAPILSIRRSFFGRPGEKVGMLGAGLPWGDVKGNGPYGIYGRLVGRLPGRTVPIATADEVKPGPALLRTVLSGRHVESFRIWIERVYPDAPDGRGLSLRVVDSRLLRKTGGIVQGMSGSPILQRGRLVGAMTHVLVGDSTRGYGVFAQWMWREVHSSAQTAISDVA